MKASWIETLALIRAQVTAENYNTYFRPLRLAEMTEERLTLEVNDAFFGDWIRDHYFDLLIRALKTSTGRPYTVEIEVVEPCEEPESEPQPKLASIIPLMDETPEFPLNPHYTFDNFVVGSANQMAHAASVSVAENPSQTFNPLFIYGGTGLGKTHLLHAIAHRIRQATPHARILYLSAEEFMNQVIKSIQGRKMDALRERYRRSCDVLLMDDVHVLAGKEATQEEFFHTFNALHAAQKQIVLTSDRTPQDISRLESRLRSRFQWGLITDIQPPQFETRVAILQEKADRDGINLPVEVALYLARLIQANVRELEGALIRLCAFASFKHKALTVEFAAEVLRGLFEQPASRLSVDSIIKLVAEHFDVSAEDLMGKRRHRTISHPRSVAMYLCRKHVQASFPQLGRDFGGKDHSTVLAACRKIKKALDGNEKLQADIESLEGRLSSSR